MGAHEAILDRLDSTRLASTYGGHVKGGVKRKIREPRVMSRLHSSGRRVVREQLEAGVLSHLDSRVGLHPTSANVSRGAQRHGEARWEGGLGQ